MSTPEGSSPGSVLEGQYNFLRTVAGSPVTTDSFPLSHTATGNDGGWCNTAGWETVVVHCQIVDGTSIAFGVMALDEAHTHDARHSGTITSSQFMAMDMLDAFGNSANKTTDTNSKAEMIEVACHGLKIFPVIHTVTGSVTRAHFRIVGGRRARGASEG